MEEKIYRYITTNCRGKENAQKGAYIRYAIGFTSGDRAFRKEIQNINANKDYPELIGAVSGKGGHAGYFTPLDDEEKEEVIANKRKRANQILKDCYIMDWKAKL